MPQLNLRKRMCVRDLDGEYHWKSEPEFRGMSETIASTQEAIFLYPKKILPIEQA